MGRIRLRAKPQIRLDQPSQGSTYSKFDLLDGSHPLKALLPDGYVDYSVRVIPTGEVLYFNFSLAQEMGLLPESHPHIMTESLKEKLIGTFSLQIVNEYDLSHAKKNTSDELLKKNKFMATRYLQLQHQSRVGKTSGDGRGIWNGQIEFKNKTWDVSSRGTGVTCLAPGAVEAKKPLKTGSVEFGYGCGQAEMDELLGAALMSEIFHLQNIATERVLCVIDLGGGVGIGVRAAPSLIRPAHLFLWLKQNRKTELKKAVDYFMGQQVQNEILPASADLQTWLLKTAERFGRFSAQLEANYIFAWMDWDGDNILADAAIIDYGSVRQFGIRHDQYRYDDVERYSTNLNEQKTKALEMIKVFCQVVDQLNHPNRPKKPILAFRNHLAVRLFNQEFKKSYQETLLYRLGFSAGERALILKDPQIFQKFFRAYDTLEKKKISAGPKKVSDGLNRPALFSMQKGFIFLLQNQIKNQSLSPQEIYLAMRSSFATTKDRNFKSKFKKPMQDLMQSFAQVLKLCSGKSAHQLGQQLERLQRINGQRLTGNALIHVVADLISNYKKAPSSLQKLMDQFIDQYLNLPEVDTYRSRKFKPKMIYDPNIFEKMLGRLKTHDEDL